MSRNAVIIDIETTGEDPKEDRICSLALIALVEGQIPPDGQLYLIYDPGRDNGTGAADRNRFGDWLLRHQKPFAHYAESLRGMLLRAPLMIGHSLAIKMNFVNRELERAGQETICPRGFCTREAAARRWPSESPALEACLARLGCKREGRKHGASEDCALTAALYLFFQGNMEPDIRYPAKPQNLRPAPPEPDSPPPRLDSDLRSSS
ncbi:MAG: hypothetical protein GDA47_02290 [Rhodospirillales bacterium]|nr:hypothetical protein [Rhodospirillales bacterium]